MIPIVHMLWIIVSYFIGCMNGGYYLVRLLRKQDIRQFGSGNAGATNTGRLLGKIGFVASFFIDIAKGLLVLWVPLVLEWGEVICVLAGIAVVVGHIWPVQLQFRGGKGIAVFLGVLLLLDVWTVGIILLVFLLLYFFYRRFVIMGLAALALSPFVMFLLDDVGSITIIGTAIITGIVIYAHRKNIREEFDRII
ncbi:glycerol-3-phosphate acyltransferase [Alkalihalobacillus sp. AL-G]|uniref:glycerol-3-phosphate acyltransferase n=1 Tax=Alkalihalobacillus sp. AL-G TaxID=2926399 RepID=UPI002729AD5C|nr:glycerol-3-phosphate acyltransferase [Alkalihalobacillus sp. AL-G]WLD94314.1 glycerol-3-phosphate acyltransferase [Alkalihalobacillus sp. AL-G]